MIQITKDEAYKIGKQLLYDDEFFKALEYTRTDNDIQRCLIDARHRLND